MKYGLIVLVVALALVLTVGVPSLDQDFIVQRWQFHYDTLLWDFIIDRTDLGYQDHTGFYLMIPDRYCYKHISGYTGSLVLQLYEGSAAIWGNHLPYTNIVLDLNGGDAWGHPFEYGLGNWCAGSIETWSVRLRGEDA